MRLYLLIALGLLVAAVSANAQTVMVQSGRYADFRQLLSREAPAGSAAIAMTLRFPDQARDRSPAVVPAVVIVHTIAGYQETNEGWHADEFRKAGFATLTYSSDAARRLREGGESAGPWASAVAEAYAAFRLLADHPRIDARRIAIVGFSFGGEVALLSAFERFRVALTPGQARFAAHVAYYPAGVFGAVAEPDAFTGAPILMLLGDKDDNLPVAKAQGYLAYAREAGSPLPIEVSIYPGAYHAWTASSLGAANFYPQYRSTRKCPYLLLGPSPPMLLVEGKGKPIDPAVMQTCQREGQGYTMGYDAGVRAESLRDALAFLSKVLRP
ncbi:MAG TPA: dienelactone hydrolase family protein [Reyranella sp.]|jgi:dienelactone hydrolase|nr:dienelactone hydrolase family protein [Reyranella sp.]